MKHDTTVYELTVLHNDKETTVFTDYDSVRALAVPDRNLVPVLEYSIVNDGFGEPHKDIYLNPRYVIEIIPTNAEIPEEFLSDEDE